MVSIVDAQLPIQIGAIAQPERGGGARPIAEILAELLPRYGLEAPNRFAGRESLPSRSLLPEGTSALQEGVSG